jgi:hypothetical protein
MLSSVTSSGVDWDSSSHAFDVSPQDVSSEATMASSIQSRCCCAATEAQRAAYSLRASENSEWAASSMGRPGRR